MTGRARVLGAAATAGAAGLVAETLLLREDLVLYGGNEIAIGAFLGLWLLAIAIGAAIARRTGDRIERAAPALLVALGLLPFAALLLARAARGLSGVPAWQPFPLGELFTWTAPIALPVSLATGALFPALSARAARHGASVSALYAAESGGAVAGGVALTGLLVLDVDPAAIAIALLALCAAASALVATGRGRRWLAAVALASAAATPAGPRLGRRLHASELAVVLPHAELDEAADTPAASYLAGHLGELHVVVEDGHVLAAFPESGRSAREAGLLGALTGAPRRLLVVGNAGFDLLDGLESLHGIDRVTWLVPDRGFVALLDRVAPGRMKSGRLHIVTGDLMRSRRRLAALGPFDAVWLLAGTPTRAEQDRLLTTTALSTLASLLAPDGRIAVPVQSAENRLGPTLRLAVGTVVAGVRSAFGAVRLVPGANGIVLGAARRDLLPLDAPSLEAAWKRLEPRTGSFTTATFTSLVDPGRVRGADRTVASLLADSRVRPSTVERPLAVFFNLLVRASDESPQLAATLEALRSSRALVWIPLGVLLVLLLAGVATARRPADTDRSAALSALAAAGACGMILDLVLLDLYATRFGTLYLDLGLLVGAYMGGVAAGAAAGRRAFGGRSPTAAGIFFFAALALGATVLATGGERLIASRATGLVALVVAGALSGAIVPVSESLLARGGAQGAAAGAGVVAGDTLGGALAGLAMGVVGIPVLGPAGASAVAAALALFGAAALALGALRQSSRLPRRARRTLVQAGYSALPFRRSARLLLVLAAIAVASRFVVSRFLRPPTVHLDAASLHATGLPPPFVEREHPVIHVVSGPHGQTGVALASRAAAPSVQGYGGPINLLVAARPDGHLARVAFLQQNETPSYIDSAPRFFHRLQGLDLTRPIAGHPPSGPPPERAPGTQEVDFITGASVTSQAVIDALDTTGRKLAGPVFHRPYAGTPASHGIDPRWLYLALSLLLVVPIVRWGGRKLRLATLAIHAALGGVLLGVQFSTAQVLSVARLDPNLDLLTWGGLLLPGVVLLAAAFGPIYCGYLCPAGAFGEALSLVGLARRLPRPVDRPARFLKYALLAAIVVAVVGLGWNAVAEADLLRTVFAPHRSGWAVVLLAIVVAGSLLTYRFWCRYLCPAGAFLHLGNRLAFGRRLIRQKRYGSCDLGVRGRLDVDCLQCDRCLDSEPLVEGARWRTRAFALLLAGSLAAMSALAWSARAEPTAAAGHSRVRSFDADAFRLRMSAGTLSDHRAMWWEVERH